MAASFEEIAHHGLGWICAGSKQRHRRVQACGERQEPARRPESHLSGLLQRERIQHLIPSSILIQQRWNGTTIITASGKGPDMRMSRIHEMIFVINVCLAQLLSLGGLSQTIAPGFIIGTHLGADSAKLSLATAAYGMALGTLILPAGRLGDMFGHKRIFVIGWLWFAVWSMFCGFSDYRGFTMLVGGRAMQGLGPALLIPNGLALIGRTFPMGLKRNFSISCFGGMGPVGMVIGSAFSSLCAEKGWWQWSFWALAVTCALISMLSLFIVPADSKRTPPAFSTGPKPKWWVKFDLPGALTGVAGLVLINFAFNEAPIVG